MKTRIILSIICVLCGLQVWAQKTTKSYSAISCQTNMGLRAAPSGLATYVHFYDDYIEFFGVGKCLYSRTNYDGSVLYTPISQGMPALRTTGILVSADCKNIQQIMLSSMMGMTMQMVYNFQWIGDGSRPAERIMSAHAPSFNNEGDGSITCHSCQGSGMCKYCQGSGRYEYGRNGRCGVCNGTGRCAGCNGKGSY